MPRRILSRIGFLILSAITAMTLAPLPAANAQANAPLLFHIGLGFAGDLWSAPSPGAALKQLTNWRYNYQPVLSPDGQTVAYLSAPRSVVADMATNGQRSGVPPANVWALNIATGNAVRIADQPANASYQTGGYILRPAAAWSPDSKQLAWVELVAADGPTVAYQLAVYDVATQKSITLQPNVPGYELPAEGLYGESVAWSNAGIGYTVLGGTDPATNQVIPSMFYLYSPQGTLQFKQKLTGDSCGVYGWVMLDQPEALLCNFTNTASSLSLLKPGSGLVTPLDKAGILNLLPANAPASHHLTWVQKPIQQPGDPSYGWQLDDHADLILNEPIAISPDGSLIAAITGKHAYTVYDKNDRPQVFTVPVQDNQQLDWIGWGPTKLSIGKG